ncbi:MAG: HAD family hydrolase [Methylobacillus sp.]|nr:HAD family hydrolase [Methylobacillus sp.]
MSLQALLFDIDGTLADTERDGHRPAFNQAFAEFGLDWNWTPELYGKLLTVTGGKERIRYFVEHYLPDFHSPDFDALVANLHKAKTRHYTAMLANGAIPLRPGIHRLLNEARQAGLRLAVVTTTTPENVTALLRYSLAEDAESWFELIAAGDIVAAKKPAPDIYLHTLQKMQLAPTQCLAFEDSRNGLLASRAAHVPTVVTVNGYTEHENFDDALVVLSDLGEPHAPFTVLKGDVNGKEYVDLELLRRWVGG